MPAAPKPRGLLHCPLCNRVHAMRLCERFRHQTTEEKWQCVRRLKYCANCLACSHETDRCTSQHRCLSCGEKHHTMLHNQHQKDNEVPSTSNPPRPSQPRDYSSSHLQRRGSRSAPPKKQKPESSSSEDSPRRSSSAYLKMLRIQYGDDSSDSSDDLSPKLLLRRAMTSLAKLQRKLR